MSEGIPAMWMRGGTSKGLYFLKEDIPANKAKREQFLLSVFGSPDKLQINGVGGGSPLTSKVAIVSKSRRPNIDVDYLFLQVAVDDYAVSSAQNCGNILAGIAPFAIERGLLRPEKEKQKTSVRIFMENSRKVAIATVETPESKITYTGHTYIDGVTFPSAPISLEFLDIEGSLCGKLLPSGNPKDEVDGYSVTMIDNGMPCVIIEAGQLGLEGNENLEELEKNCALRESLERLRLKCGKIMKLGNVKEKTVPKMTIVSKPLSNGMINTRTFIPHKCHHSIGVFGAISVATACLIEDTPANKLSLIPSGEKKLCAIEHPSGKMEVLAELRNNKIISTAILRTARKLFDGVVFSNNDGLKAS
jgi:4-oxalomesaconate tautomerase